MNLKDVSIIIPFHKDKQMLELSLKTLEESFSENAQRPEIIIVANNYDVRQIDISYRQFDYKIYKINENIFWPGAINYGVEQSEGAYVLFCDPDVFYTKGWLEHLIKSYESHPKAGVVSSKLVNPLNNRIMDWGMGYNQFNTIHINKGLLYSHPLLAYDRQTQAACGAIFLTRKDLFNKVNGIDKDMPYIYCDNDYSIKLAELGYETWVSAQSIVYHKGNTDSNNSKYQNYTYLREDSKAAFYAKNKEKRRIDTEKWLLNSWKWYQNHHTCSSVYYLYDFCTLLDSCDYVKLFEQSLDLNIVNQRKVVLSNRDTLIINLCNYIEASMINSNIPFIFFVDDFTSLFHNKLMFSLRDCADDIVIDRHCNIVSMSEIILETI